MRVLARTVCGSRRGAWLACPGSFWPDEGEGFPDARAGKIPEDTGLQGAAWQQITEAYNANMEALRARTLAAGKFAWQLMWTGPFDADEGAKGQTGPTAIVTQQTCATALRVLCNETAPPQTRAMMYALQTKVHHDPSQLAALKQDLANFLLVRGPFAWLGHGWMGCSKQYPFPPEFNLDCASLTQRPPHACSPRGRQRESESDSESE